MTSARSNLPLRLTIAAVILIAVGLGFVLGRLPFRADDTGGVHRSQIGQDMPASRDIRAVVARGRLEPDGGVVNLGAPMGERLQRIVVSAGQRVTEGQELAFLDSHPDRLADLALAKSQLAEAVRRGKAVADAGQCSIEEADISKEQIEKIEPLDIQAQAARVRLIEDQLSTARTDLARLHALKLNSVPQQQVEMQTLAVRKAEEELIAARAALDKAKAGHELNRRAAAAKVRAARANLARYQAEIPTDSLHKTIAQAEARLAHTVLRAPHDGKILKIIAHAGETTGSQPILQMGNTARMTAVAEVYETDVQFVKLGAAATITSPALPKPIHGKVTSIGSIVARNRLYDLDPTAAADLRVIDVKITLDTDDPAADFVNLQVTVTVEAGTAKE